MGSTPLEQNQLLNSLPQDSLELIRPYLKQVFMPVREVVERPNEPITHVYFPIASILSVVAGNADARIEVGIIGRDGMSGTCVVLGADSSPHECFVQIADGALRMSVPNLRAAMTVDPVLRDHLLLYIRSFMLQNYVHEVRIEEAKQIIETESCSLDDVGYKIGYETRCSSGACSGARPA